MGTFREEYESKKKSHAESSFRERYEASRTDLNAVADSVRERTNTWLKNHYNYLRNYESRYKGATSPYREDWQNWHDTVKAQKNNFDAEAESIRSLLDRYAGKSKEWDSFAEGIKNILTAGRVDQSRVIEQSIQDVNFSGKFKSLEDFEKWDSGWLSEDATVDYDSAQKRKAYYEKNQNRIAEIKNSLPFGGGSWLPNWTEDIWLSEEEEKLRDEYEARTAEVQRYEREQKATDDYFRPATEEFKRNAANRDYGVLRLEDLGQYRWDDAEYLDSILDTQGKGLQDNIGFRDNGSIVRWAVDPETGEYVVDPKTGEYVKEVLVKSGRDFQDDVTSRGKQVFTEDKLGYYLTDPNERDAIASRLRAIDSQTMNTDAYDNIAGYYEGIVYEGIEGNWEFLKENEIDIYYDLLAREGKESACAFLDAMKPTLHKRAAESNVDDIMNNKDPYLQLLYNVGSVPMNVVGGAMGFAEDAVASITGNEVDPYSHAHRWQIYAQAIRDKTAGDIDDATGNIAIPWIDFSAGDAYQSIMSAADSFVGAGTLGQGYSVLAGMGAASAKARELYDKGATKEQIVVGSALAGAAELVFEAIGIENLLKAKDAKNVKDVIFNALKQAGVEGLEEMGTEYTNQIWDAIIMGSQSDWVDFDTFVQNVVNAGLGGFLSGGVGGGTMAAAGSALQAADYQAAVKDHGQAITDFGDVESLQKHAEAMIKDKNTPNVWEIKQQLKKVQNNPSAKNVGRLSAAMSDSVRMQNRKENVQQLKKEGLSKKQADSVYNAILQMEDSISRAGSDTARLAAEQKFVDALAEMGLDDATQSAVAAVAQDLIENPQNASQSRLRELMNSRVNSVDPKDLEILQRRKEISTEGRISSDGTTRLETTGETVQIRKEDPIAKIENGTVFLNTDKGVLETSDLQFANEEELHLYEAVSDLDAGTASVIVTGYDGNIPALDYVSGMEEGVLLYGKHGFQTVGKDISDKGYFAGLSEVNQQTALALGRELRAEETRQKTERVREAIERAKADREKSAKTQKNTAENSGGEIKNQLKGVAPDGKKIYEANFPKGTPKAAKSERILNYIKDVWSKNPIALVISNGETSREIQAQFDPTVPENPRGKTDATKIAGGNRHGSASDRRVTLDLADDYYEIASEAKYDYSKVETGKDSETHKDVRMWHYFVNEIYFVEQGSDEMTPYTVTINVKEKDNGSFVYSFNAEKDSSTRRTLHADVRTRKGTNGEIFFDDSIAQKSGNVKGQVFFDESVELNELTKKQRAEVEYAGNVISAVIGNEIHFFDSRHAPADSREAKTNGWYDPSDGSIHLDIAKVENGEESVLFTLSHELTHFIEDWSPAKYQTFANFLLKNYAEHGVKTDTLVRRKMAELKTSDYDYAMSELVADACERMLLDSNASEKLAELNKTDKGLVAKIKSFLANTLKKIRQAYTQYKGREEAQLLQKMEDKLSEFHALFEDALADAAQNYRDADGKLEINKSQVKDQLKKSFTEDVDLWLQGQYKKSYFDLGTTPDVFVKHGARYLPVIMTEEVLSKVTGGKHAISLDEIKRLPEQLNDPVLLFKGSRPASFVALTELKDKSGIDVICAVHLERTQDRIKVNRIASLYGKDNIVDYVSRNIAEGNLLDASKEKAPTWLSSRGLQLPKLVQDIVDANNSIPQKSESVNTIVDKNGKKDSEMEQKKLQLEIINETNPAPNTYSTWIRSEDDIKTLAETLEDSDWADGEEFNPDLTRTDIQNAIREGTITVYSSYPIKNGVFVSPSYMEAESYSGDGRVYRKTVDIRDVAWIDPTQGQYAKVTDGSRGATEVREQAKIVHRYGYDSLTSKSPMTVSQLQSVSESDYAKYAKDRYAFSKEMRENARKKGNKKNTGTNVYLYCDDLGKDVLVSAKSFGHGAARIDDTYVSVCRQIGDILENSIIVNELQPRENSDNSYVALGLAETETDYVVVRSLISQRTWELTSYEILYAIKKESINKKMLAYSPRITLQKSGSTTSSVISITDFLQIVKGAKLANSVLSDDVLKNLKEQRISDQNVTPNLKYQQKQNTTREILANADLNAIDLSNRGGDQLAAHLKDYQGKEKELKKHEDKVRSLSEDILRMRKAREDGKPYDSSKMDELLAERNRESILASQLRRSMQLITKAPEVSKFVEREKLTSWRQNRDEIERGKMERARVTELKHRARKKAETLNKMLTKPTKKIHVKSGLQKAVASFLYALNLDTVNYENRIKFLETRLKFAEQEVEEELKRSGITKENAEAFEEQFAARVEKRIKEITASKEWNELRNMSMLDKISDLRKGLATYMEEENIAETPNRKMILELLDRNSVFLEVSAKQRVEDLKTKIENEEDPVERAYLSVRLEMLNQQKDFLPLGAMSLGELQVVDDSLSQVLAMVRDANKVFDDNKAMEAADASDAARAEVKLAKKPREIENRITEVGDAAFWRMLMPETAFHLIGSDTLVRLYEDITDGSHQWGVLTDRAHRYFAKTAERYNYLEWRNDETLHSFQSSNGKTFQLNLQEIMSLYAYSRRGDQALDHIINGGVVKQNSMVPATKTVEKNGKEVKIPFGYKPESNTAYKISRETLKQMFAVLKPEQKKFVEEMQKYLSEDCSEQGNKTSLILYGIRLFKEKIYFPIRTWSEAEAFDPDAGGDSMIVNSSFTKATIKGATRAIVLDKFETVWAKHTEEMARYATMSVPVENFLRVWNVKSASDLPGNTPETLSTVIRARWGAKASEYVRKFISDVNGGSRKSQEKDPLDRALSRTKKAAVVASLSVAIQQPSSIARAAAYIDPKYMVKGSLKNIDLREHEQRWEEVKKYAPVAITKEMGGFDTGVGKGTVDWILSYEYGKVKERLLDIVKDPHLLKRLMSEGDEVFGWLPSFMDEISWGKIWFSCKRQVAAEQGLDIDSEKCKIEAGKLFTTVINRTQVYDSSLVKSGLMRNKNLGAKLLSQFAAEPTVSVNMHAMGIIEASRNGRKGRNFFHRTNAAILCSKIINAALVAVIYALRDEDEDETLPEKYLEHFIEKGFDELNPLNSFPVLRDFNSWIQGFSSERPDADLAADLIYTTKQWWNDEKTVLEKLRGSAESLSSMFGIPVKNILRDADAVARGFLHLFGKYPRTTTKQGLVEAMKKALPFAEVDKSESLYDAYVSGDAAQIERYRDNYDTEEKWTAAVRAALKENDPRIQQAAIAQLSGNASERVRIQKEIIGEGNFSQDLIVTATNGLATAFQSKIRTASEAKKAGRVKEYEKIVKELQKAGYPDELISKYIGDKVKALQEAEEAEAEQGEKATSWYKSSDVAAAYASGDEKLALEIINDLIRVKAANSTEEKAEDREKAAKSSVKSIVTEYWKPRYQEAYTKGNQEEMKRIRYLLKDTGLYGSVDDLIKTCNRWTLEKEKNE